MFQKHYGLAKLLILGGCELRPLEEWISVVLEERNRRNAEREEQQRFGIFNPEQDEDEVRRTGATKWRGGFFCRHGLHSHIDVS